MNKQIYLAVVKTVENPIKLTSYHFSSSTFLQSETFKASFFDDKKNFSFS